MLNIPHMFEPFIICCFLKEEGGKGGHVQLHVKHVKQSLHFTKKNEYR